MLQRLRAVVLTAAVTLVVLVAAAVPASAKEFAPQPVDTSEQGALGFVLMAVMVGIIAASLFYMDRIRKRRMGD